MHALIQPGMHMPALQALTSSHPSELRGRQPAGCRCRCKDYSCCARHAEPLAGPDKRPGTMPPRILTMHACTHWPEGARAAVAARVEAAAMERAVATVGRAGVAADLQPIQFARCKHVLLTSCAQLDLGKATKPCSGRSRPDMQRRLSACTGAVGRGVVSLWSLVPLLEWHMAV